MSGDAAMREAARLYGAGDLRGALLACERILAGEPRHFHALHLAATIALREGRHEDCVGLASRALEIQPGHAEVLSNRGAALRALCRFDEALADYDASLATAPRAAATLSNRGVTLAALGRHREALRSYDAALQLQPDYPRARLNRALSRLMVGEFGDAWNDYESRWAGGETPSSPRPFRVPEFSGHDWGQGHRTALWTEQGLGDQVLFATLVAEFAARGESFVLEVDARLLEPFKRAHPDWEVVARERSEAAFATCDRHLALASAGRLLRTDEASFSRQPRALLAADPARAARYRERLHAQPAGVVGISWRTFQPRLRTYYELTKSAPLAAFMELSHAPDLRLLDLQYGDTAAEREAFARAGGRLQRLEGLDLFNDIDGLLAAICACDVVVTTSNVTAHLAGAVGKRTLLVYLSARPPFHYWAPDAAGRCRWYPSVELVTGPGLDNWPAVLRRAAQLLDA
jgi:hypothetical protein